MRYNDLSKEVPMADRVVEEYKRVKGFRDLVESTISALGAAGTPHALVRAIDGILPQWEQADKEFASVLKEVKGQAFSMELPHLRAVTQKLREHLEVNLSRIEKGLGKM